MIRTFLYFRSVQYKCTSAVQVVNKEMTIADKLNTAYVKLLRDMQDDCFANASEREVVLTKLPDGREAQVTMKIETDADVWM